MIDPTVSQFFTKNPESDYMAKYEYSHGPRLDALAARHLTDLKNQKVVDVGGGMGFLGRRLDSSNHYWVIDGADIPDIKCTGPIGQLTLCKGVYVKQDIDRDYFSNLDWYENGERFQMNLNGYFDAGFALEVLEHLSNPYHCLVELKKVVKPGGLIYISIPTESVWHNVVYPGLLWPIPNFSQWLGQMALPVIDFWEYKPVSIGWPAYTFVCRNDPWSSKTLLYPKEEAKFRDCTPLQATNL
jgi:SAM-dependent methyltransferase